MIQVHQQIFSKLDKMYLTYSHMYQLRSVVNMLDVYYNTLNQDVRLCIFKDIQ